MLYFPFMRGVLLLVGLVAVFLLGGCATQKNLYNWGPYQSQLYTYFKSNDASYQSQISQLERNLQVAASKGDRVPPGYHAHLGLLYLQTGAMDKALASWQRESSLFPEFSPYMNFLKSNMKKSGS